MNLDIRLPMGLMFTLVGAIIAGFGLWTSSDAKMYEKSLSYNINLWWGLVMFLFGLAMLGLAWRASKSTPVAQAARPEQPEPRVGGH
jgi:hypothetical protein